MSKTETTTPDPSAVWRDWMTQSERQWNEFFNQMMGTEEFSQNMGRNLDVFLHFQKTMSEAMGPYLTAMNVPTRTDVLALGDRLLAMENRLAAIEAQLSTLQASLEQGAAAKPSAKPRRTKRPASSDTN
jgi:polyhydroxyalkanoic acid synthase PhaR subunit